jgi:hypothetical protein
MLIKCRGVGKATTREERDTYLEALKVFRQWFNENILSSVENSLSDAIMIMPYGSANPKFRDSANE